MLHVAGAGHRAAHIDHGGNHRPCDGGAQPLDVIDAVLQRQHHGIGRKMRRDRARGLVRRRRFHAEQHQPRALNHRRLDTCRHGDLLAAAAQLQGQAVLANGVHMAWPADKRDRLAGAREHAAVVAADRARPHHRDLAENRVAHDHLPCAIEIAPTVPRRMRAGKALAMLAFGQLTR